MPGRLVRAGPVLVHFAPAGPFFGDFAPTGSLPAHSARDGPVGALAWAGPVVGHLAQPVLWDLERVVRILPVPVDLALPTTPGIA